MKKVAIGEITASIEGRLKTEPKNKEVRIGIFDYLSLHQVACYLTTELRRGGYKKVKYVSLEGDPIPKILEGNVDRYDVFLIHPGPKNQKEVEKFIETHREKRTALIALGMKDYEKKYGILLLPYYPYRCDEVIDFIEGRI